MGPGGCFWSILHLNMAKGGKVKGSSGRRNGGDKHFLTTSGVKRIEDVTAPRIQTAVRAFLARKTLRRRKCAEKFQGLSRGPSVREQVTSTNEWSSIQSEITARRICMVTEARLKQKKLENHLKFEAKLHNLEAPERWMKFLQSYTRGRKEHQNVSELWLTHSLISGEPTPATTLARLLIFFTKTWAGAGWSVGWLHGHWKFVYDWIEKDCIRNNRTNQQSHMTT